MPYPPHFVARLNVPFNRTEDAAVIGVKLQL